MPNSSIIWLDEARIGNFNATPEYVYENWVMGCANRGLGCPKITAFKAEEDIPFIDEEFPRWFDNSTNGTDAGDTIEHSIRWTDNDTLNSHIFSWNNGANWTAINTSADAESGTQEMVGAGTGTPTYVDSTEATSGASQVTSLAITVPSHTDGDIMITVFGITETEDSGTDIKNEAGWTFITSEDVQNAVSDPNISVWWREASSEPASYTWENEGTTTGMAGQILVYSGIDTADPIQTSNTTDDGGVDGCPIAPSINTVGDNEMVLFIGFMDDDEIPATEADYYPTGTTGREATETSASNGLGVGTAEELIASSSTTTGKRDFRNCVAVEEWAGITISLNAGSGDTDANVTAVTYSDVISDIYEIIANITVTVNVSVYVTDGSTNNSNSNPDLFLEIFDGTDWIELGNMSVNAAGNFSIETQTALTLSGWQDAEANRDIRFTGVYFDGINSTTLDTINWTDVWVETDSQQEFLNDTSVTFTGTQNYTNISQVVNSTVGAIIQWLVYADDGANNFNTTETFSYATTSGAADSCTYTSGDFVIDCTDNCVISSNVVVDSGSDVIITGAGELVLSANITGYDTVEFTTCDIFV